MQEREKIYFNNVEISGLCGYMVIWYGIYGYGGFRTQESRQ